MIKCIGDLVKAGRLCYSKLELAQKVLKGLKEKSFKTSKIIKSKRKSSRIAFIFSNLSGTGSNRIH